MIKLILADDHRILREGLKRLLNEDGRFSIVAEADNGEEALRLILELQPDVAILDLSMPRLDGIEVVENIRAEKCGTRCIILTMNDDIRLVRKAIKAGACGYLLKESAFEELARAVVAVNSGRRYLGDFQDDPKLFVDEAIPLTKRENEILRLVVSSMTSHEIAANLGVSIRTVETHRQNIMNKLNVHSAPALVAYCLSRNQTGPASK